MHASERQVEPGIELGTPGYKASDLSTTLQQILCKTNWEMLTTKTRYAESRALHCISNKQARLTRVFLFSNDLGTLYFQRILSFIQIIWSRSLFCTATYGLHFKIMAWRTICHASACT